MSGTRKLWGADVHYCKDDQERYAFCPRCQVIFTWEHRAVIEPEAGQWICSKCAAMLSEEPKRKAALLAAPFLDGDDFLEAALDGI